MIQYLTVMSRRTSDHLLNTYVCKNSEEKEDADLA